MIIIQLKFSSHLSQEKNAFLLSIMYLSPTRLFDFTVIYPSVPYHSSKVLKKNKIHSEKKYTQEKTVIVLAREHYTSDATCTT